MLKFPKFMGFYFAYLKVVQLFLTAASSVTGRKHRQVLKMISL